MDEAQMPEQGAAPQEGPSADERQWAMFCHLAGLASNVMPFGNVIGPLVVWLIKKDVYPMVDDQGKEALNFQITMTLAALVCIPFAFLFCTGFFLIMAVHVYSIVMAIVAGVKANSGEPYRYPITIRFVS
ncbi:DUF4870 domain-containing protein [Planctomycetota bacterium]